MTGFYNIHRPQYLFSSYLRAFFIFSRYPFSQAWVLMARIPETTWVIKEMRWSDISAVRKRSAALRKDSPPKYGTRRHRKRTPITVCQPIKYTSKTVTTANSGIAKTEQTLYFTTSCSNRWTSFDKRSMTWPVVNSSNELLLRRSVCRTRKTKCHNQNIKKFEVCERHFSGAACVLFLTWPLYARMPSNEG